jgi:tetraacyldisaccharide 4'-kinase
LATDGGIVFGPSEFRELVSGRRRGTAAMLTRVALRALEFPYSAAVGWRNRRYDTGRAAIARVDVPVVSVGNITLGGTGKTPTVEWMARWFFDRGARVALVSRGYGAKNGAANDEAMELAKNLPHVPHLLDADRVRAARHAIGTCDCQVLILDDAFQHRRIARDLDIVLIDALEPFGFGHVFPRGTLREPLAGWARADVLMLTRAESLGEVERTALRARVRQHAPHATWVEATHAPRCLESAVGAEQPLAALAGQSVAAFCGIGNPAGFRRALEGCGYRIAGWRAFADHYAYRAEDLEALAGWADELAVAAVVCTGKDLVKIGDRWQSKKPLWALSSRLEILAGQAELEAALEPLLERAKQSP